MELFGRHPQYRVTLIETDPETCEFVSEELPETDIVLGNATDPDTLKEAVGEDTSTFVAITGDDHVNLLASEAARQMGLSTVILRIKDPQYRKLCRLIGLENVLNPADSVCLQIITRVNEVDLADMIYSVYPDIEMKAFLVQDHPRLEDVSIEDMNQHVKPEVYPILLLREDRYLLPSDAEVLQTDDTVITWVRKEEGLLQRYHLGEKL